MALASWAFFDGSGKKDTPAISLAGIAAPEVQWGDFDSDWHTTLNTHGADCFHMSPAINLATPFSQEEGWTKDKVDLLIRDLVKLMGEYSNRGFQFRACTVIRGDYARVKREHANIRPLPAICSNFCVGGLALPKKYEFLLYFDKNEAFMKQVYRVWNHLKNKPTQRPRWVEQTRNILPVDSGYYGIQAADFIAWSVNREHALGDYPQWAMFAKILAEWKLYDYDALVEEYAHDEWY